MRKTFFKHCYKIFNVSFKRIFSSFDIQYFPIINLMQKDYQKVCGSRGLTLAVNCNILINHTVYTPLPTLPCQNFPRKKTNTSLGIPAWPLNLFR